MAAKKQSMARMRTLERRRRCVGPERRGAGVGMEGVLELVLLEIEVGDETRCDVDLARSLFSWPFSRRVDAKLSV